MGAGWVAGTVRARALLSRRVGAAEARRLAGLGSTDAVVRDLTPGPYGRELPGRRTTAEVEAGIGAAVLWHLRVLSGWLPGAGARTVRLLAAWFEIANTVDHARRLAGATGNALPPYRLGALATAWPRLSTTTSLAGLRAELTRSPWGDPGAEDPAAIAIAMAVTGASRVADLVPEAGDLAAGAAALQVAREVFLSGRELPHPVHQRAAALLGAGALAAHDLGTFAGALRPAAGWALAGTAGPDQLVEAERAWWQRVERDARSMLAGAGFGPAAAVGCVLALAADARRVRAAAVLAARGGTSPEVFDAAF
jgi:hypothetical protein